MAHFESWSHDHLVKFAYEALKRMEEHQEKNTMIKKEVEFVIPSQYHDSIRVSEYDENKVWVSTHVRGGSTYTVLTIDQATQLIEALTKIAEAQK